MVNAFGFDPVESSVALIGVAFFGYALGLFLGFVRATIIGQIDSPVGHKFQRDA